MQSESGSKEIRTERWSSVEEVTEHLGVARDTIYRWVKSRKLPAHRIGRIWKFKLSEIDEWVRAQGASHGRRRASVSKATRRK